MNIETNKSEYLGDFIRLNEEWISTYFEIEETDRQLAANPQKILDEGGFVFCLLVDQEVVGVCALFKESEGVYELARMAVSPAHHGKGYGKKLMETCMKKLRELQAEKVFLVSNTLLKSALSLYRSYGFATLSEGPHPRYSRANIVMEKQIT